MYKIPAATGRRLTHGWAHVELDDRPHRCSDVVAFGWEEVEPVSVLFGSIGLPTFNDQQGGD
jgi:hypothetical protein